MESEEIWDLLTQRNVNGATALHHAAAFSHHGAVGVLLRALAEHAPTPEAHAAQLVATTTSGFSVLHHSAVSASDKVANIIVATVDEVCPRGTLDLLRQADAQAIWGITPAQLAVRIGARTETVQLLSPPPKPAVGSEMRTVPAVSGPGTAWRKQLADSLVAALERGDVKTADALVDGVDRESLALLLTCDAVPIALAAVICSPDGFRWWCNRLDSVDIPQEELVTLLLGKASSRRPSDLHTHWYSWTARAPTRTSDGDPYNPLVGALRRFCVTQADGSLALHSAAESRLLQSPDDVALFLRAASIDSTSQLLGVLVRLCRQCQVRCLLQYAPD
jgi:hypothetical protein